MQRWEGPPNPVPIVGHSTQLRVGPPAIIHGGSISAMSSSDSMRRAALTLLFALSIGVFVFALAAGEAASSSSGSGGSYQHWLPEGEQEGDQCGSDGDPDNPTVDQPPPQTRGNGEATGDVVSAKSGKWSLRVSWEVWLTRLLQLMGIR